MSTRPSASTRERVPAHLRRFVVEQDYGQYDEIDQAVWRFVLLQMYGRLKRSAHPAYAEGLGQTGISVERIPSIQQMDECLGRFGWGAVCVNGFIPPRAFQEFQAEGILPISADIRTVEHLVYTPAPDIIHEAAGHAPILPDPEYGDYVRRIGRAGALAFSLPEDERVYRAVFALSEMKEDPAATPEQIALSEHALESALAGATRVSEVARLSRLYWWTAEYGLVGTVRDYRLYGAGLLSSLGESYFCHEPNVEKIPLSAACVDVAYDITRPQPRLFVARDFAQLGEVLDEVTRDLAVNVGGLRALQVATESRELASVELDSGVAIIGVLDGVELTGGEPSVLRFVGPVGICAGGRLLTEHGPSDHADGLTVVLGRSSAGIARHELTESQIRRQFERLPPTLGAAVRSVRAGAVDPAYHPPSEFSKVTIPRPRSFGAERRALLTLYERALAVLRTSRPADIVAEFERIHDELEARSPDEWLLRWNLLESLLRLESGEALAARLQSELVALEIRFAHQQPIDSGLGHLGLRTSVGI